MVDVKMEDDVGAVAVEEEDEDDDPPSLSRFRSMEAAFKNGMTLLCDREVGGITKA